MVFCIVVGCGNTSQHTKNISYFRIPSDTDNTGKFYGLRAQRRKKWIEAINRADLTKSILKYERVCSEHFISGKPANLYDTTSPDWVPTLKMGYEYRGSKNDDTLQTLE